MVHTYFLIFVIHGFFGIQQSLLRFIDCRVINRGSRYLQTLRAGGAIGDVFHLPAAVASQLVHRLVYHRAGLGGQSASAAVLHLQAEASREPVVPIVIVLGSSLASEQERGRPTVFTIIITKDRAEFTFLLVDGALDVGRFDPGFVVEESLDVDLVDLQRVQKHVDTLLDISSLFRRIDFVDVIIFLICVFVIRV